MILKNKTDTLRKYISDMLDFDNGIPYNEDDIKKYVFHGFSDEQLRARYWKLFLNYFPDKKVDAIEFYIKQRRFYTDLEFSGYAKPIRRILLKFASINSAVGYVQGMIQLIIPIYHVLITNNDEENAFFMFHNLISEMSECYTSFMDDNPKGTRGKMENVFAIIKRKDHELYDVLLEKGLLDTTFTLRWIVQLFTSVFDLEECLFVWDKIFADPNRFEIVEYFCAVLILFKREELKLMNFGNCMKLLQNLGHINVEKMCYIGLELQNSSKSFNCIFNEYLLLKLKHLDKY